MIAQATEQAVVEFTADRTRTLAFYLKHHGEPHFVYEFLSVLESVYRCPPEEVPPRFAQLVSNFLGARDGIQPWERGVDFLRDHGKYLVEVYTRPWHIRRQMPPLPTSSYQNIYQGLDDAEVQAERDKATRHTLIVSGKLRREIRDKNDQHFLAIRSVPAIGEPAR